MQAWRNRMEISVTDQKIANEIALDALNQGIDEIAFLLNKQTTENINFSVLLENILLPYCAVSFEILGNIDVFVEKYLTYIKTQNYDNQALSGSITAISNNLLFCDNEKVPKNIKTITIKPSSNTIDNSQQIADILQQLRFQLTTKNSKKNINPTTIFERLQVEITVGNLYFVEIAKLRALRLLLLQLASMHNCEMQVYKFCIHAKTTLQTLQNHLQNSQNTVGVNQNLLSNTIQAMAAIVGGCTVLTIMPHTTEKPAFAARIARNISNLLKEESYLDKVIDVANGSYYIEQLTDKIAEKAWEIFMKNS
jgi:methylmalonyl-CoA mutase